MAKSALGRGQPFSGAGPIGLEVATCRCALGYTVTVFERGQAAEAIRHWGHVQLFTPFGMNHTPLGRRSILETSKGHVFPADSECVTGWQHHTAYLEPLAACACCQRTACGSEREVLAIGKSGLLKHERPGDAQRAAQPFRLLLRDEKQRETTEEADVVLDCTGTYGRHRWVGEGRHPGAAGERPAAQSNRLWSGRCARRPQAALCRQSRHGGGRRLLGCHDHRGAVSAFWSNSIPRCGSRLAGAFRGLAADQANSERSAQGTRSTRRQGQSPGNAHGRQRRISRPRDHRQRRTGRRPGAAHQRPAGGQGTIVGSGPPYRQCRLFTDNDLYRELQVQECFSSLGPKALADALVKQAGSDSLELPPTGPESLRTTEPNFFVLGAKSFGRSSRFFLRNGFAQIREAFALLSGKADLDLYKAAGK